MENILVDIQMIPGYKKRKKKGNEVVNLAWLMIHDPSINLNL